LLVCCSIHVAQQVTNSGALRQSRSGRPPHSQRLGQLFDPAELSPLFREDGIEFCSLARLPDEQN
jgi:hypothetical protein